MKKIIISFFFIIFSSISFSQELKFSELKDITSRGEYTSYLASDGAVYKVGDRIKIGVPSSNKTFSFIRMGYGIVGTEFAPVTVSGFETAIKEIRVIGTDRMGYTVGFITSGPTKRINYMIQFENAIISGEIKGSGMSSDEALATLKKAKDKLDLGLIKQEEFDSLKTKLKGYIK